MSFTATICFGFFFDPATLQHMSHAFPLVDDVNPHVLQRSSSKQGVCVTFNTPSLLETFLTLLHNVFLLEFPTISNFNSLVDLETTRKKPEVILSNI
jgi:hypothetical protein